jgi:iron complex outermembrane receptor protein
MLAFLGLVFFSSVAACQPRSQSLIIDFSIEKGPLAEALIVFARQSELSVIADEQLLIPFQAPTIQGPHTTTEALFLLLESTSLGYRFLNANTVVVSSEYNLPSVKIAEQSFEVDDSYLLESLPIEEVIVTSLHRRENLQDVAAAVTVLDQKVLIEDQLISLESVASRVPGLTVSNFSLGQPTIHMRGIGSNDDGAAMDNSVVVFVDDVYVGRITSMDFSLLDLSRVEILRGSQGALYGKNSIGGAIKLVSNEATVDKQVAVKLSLGNYRYQGLNFLANGSLDKNQQWLGRLMFDARQRDGWQENIVLGGEKQHDDKRWNIRSQLRYLHDDDLEFSWRFDVSKNNLNSTGRIPVEGRVLIPTDQDPMFPDDAFTALGGDPEHATNGINGYTDRQIIALTQHVNYQYEEMELLSITALRYTDFKWLEDSTGLPASTTSQTVALLDDEQHNQFSQEFRWRSDPDKRLSYVLGLYYLFEETVREESFLFQQGITAISLQDNRTSSASFYGQLNYLLNADIQVTVGGRLSYDKKHLNQTATNGGAQLIIFEDFDVSSKANWQDFSPQLTVSYTGIEDVLLYAGIAKGTKSGGFQGSPPTLALASQEIDPESAWDYEIGIKSEWFERQLRVNAAAFYIDYRDLQVVQFQTINNFGQFQTTNAASASVMGLELELTARLNEALSLSASYAYLDARYDSFNDLMGRDFTDNHLRQAPEETVKVAVDYNLTLPQGDLSLHADYRYQSESFREPDNTVARLPAFYAVDANFSFLAKGKVWEWGLWVKNLTNEQTISHLYVLGGNDYALYAMSRSYGLNLGYHFL